MITNTELEQKGNQFPNQIVSFLRDADTFYFTTENGVVLELTALRNSAFRFRYATDLTFQADFSYAISPEATRGYNSLDWKEAKEQYEVWTPKVKVCIQKKNLKVRILDADGNLINEDELGFHWEENYTHGGNLVKMSKVTQTSESYYGLGDKATHSNLKGKRLNNWVTDQYGYGKDQDPLYKAIPFYIGLHSGIAYGIFFDNSFRTFFDFAHERRTRQVFGPMEVK